MSRRNDKGQFAKPPSKRVLTLSWVLSVLSVALLWFCASMVMSTFGAFRSCGGSNGVTIESCGKSSLNFGDLMVIVLFVLAASLALSLITHAWRLTRRALP